MSSAVAAVLALAVLVLLGLWIWNPARAKEPAPPAPSAQGGALVVPGAQVIEVQPVGPGALTRGDEDPKAVEAAMSFDGQGVIRGRIGERGGAVFPLEWDLILEPDPFLIGHERAETRRVPLRAGERVFRVENLRLGGYRVRAEAPALNCIAAQVLLVKGSPDQSVELAFTPAGWFDGSVLDAQGAPAEGVEVELSEETTKARLQTTTDVAGAFQFRALLDGDYEITFGAGGQPLLEPRLVSFRAPRLSFPQVSLPATGTLAVRVYDLLGKPAAGVRVTGFGRPRGRIDQRTDEQGLARLRWAVPGRWEVEALDETEQLSARGETEFEARAEAQVVLRLAR